MRFQATRSLWVSGCLVALGLSLVAALFFADKTPRMKGLHCNNMLRQVDAAKEQTAKELGLTNGQTVSVEQIAPYIKGGFPTGCDAGGTYSINPLGQNPTCSLADPHAIGERDCWHNLPTP